MLLVANLANTRWCKTQNNLKKLTHKSWKMTETWHMGTHERVLDESYPMNTNMTGFRWHTLHLIDKKYELILQ